MYIKKQIHGSLVDLTVGCFTPYRQYFSLVSSATIIDTNLFLSHKVFLVAPKGRRFP